MVAGLIGNKIGMTQIFDESGNIIPVTILKVGPCVVTQVKTELKDGYDAIQIGYGNVSNKKLTQPELGHLQKSNIQPLRYLKEFHINKDDEFSIGSAQEQPKHREMMKNMGNHAHNSGSTVTVKPGKAKQLLWHLHGDNNVDFACNIPGDAEAGMVKKVSL